MRVVLDTNVFISAVLGGRLRVIVNEWKAGGFTLIVSEAIVREYLIVVNRPKFKVTATEIANATDYLLNTAEFVTPSETIRVISADPTDNKFLEAALEGKTDCIVSGDTHLLELKTFRGIPIFTAHEFINRLKIRE